MRQERLRDSSHVDPVRRGSARSLPSQSYAGLQQDETVIRKAGSRAPCTALCGKKSLPAAKSTNSAQPIMRASKNSLVDPLARYLLLGSSWITLSRVGRTTSGTMTIISGCMRSLQRPPGSRGQLSSCDATEWDESKARTCNKQVSKKSTQKMLHGTPLSHPGLLESNVSDI